MSGSESNITGTDTAGLIISGGSGPATRGRWLQNYCVLAATVKLCAKAGHRNLIFPGFAETCLQPREYRLPTLHGGNANLARQPRAA